MTYESWTDEEIQRYQEKTNPLLVSYYLGMNLTKKKPWERLKHLQEKTNCITMTDEKIFSNLSKQKQRDKILLLLENEILKDF